MNSQYQIQITGSHNKMISIHFANVVMVIMSGYT